MKNLNNLPLGSENDPNAPWNQNDNNECSFCGASCINKYCNDDCRKTDLL